MEGVHRVGETEQRPQMLRAAVVGGNAPGAALGVMPATDKEGLSSARMSKRLGATAGPAIFAQSDSRRTLTRRQSFSAIAAEARSQAASGFPDISRLHIKFFHRIQAQTPRPPAGIDAAAVDSNHRDAMENPVRLSWFSNLFAEQPGGGASKGEDFVREISGIRVWTADWMVDSDNAALWAGDGTLDVNQGITDFSQHGIIAHRLAAMIRLSSNFTGDS